MGYVARTIIVVSFCAGTVGAAGMKDPPEEWAFFLLAGGVAGLVAGWLLERSATRTAAGGAEHHERREWFVKAVGRVCSAVSELDEEKGGLDGPTLCQRIDEILAREYFDLTARHEELAALIGFAAYARVWEGVATAERLLARAWSIATDGSLEEALEALPAARAQLEHADQAMRGA